MENRTIDLPGVFGVNAATTIPSYPVPGTGYRKADAGNTDIQNGWLYDGVVDSSVHNQMMYLLTAMMQILSQQGMLNWCATTNYAASALCMGSDGKIYQALASNVNVDPTADTTNTKWKKFAMSGAYQTVVPITASGGGAHVFEVNALGDNSNLLIGSFNILDAANEGMGFTVTVSHPDGTTTTLYDGSSSVNYVVGFSPTFMCNLSKGTHTVTITLLGASCQLWNPSGTNAGFMSLQGY